ncbi:hypothetical protein IMCC3317_22600 [Kordia antarctica]|uniref:Peptide zinc metalloprotease protein YydH n=1 Tax=Kordia antarctica TaxID=1218801 RepID=A0A7L4ZK34_9FLAO|nr:hypothetical protein [Kordia antarctica]QHI36890.1 hypothetical protein IMCC3317_22600 [Kordia antarctica]
MIHYDLIKEITLFKVEEDYYTANYNGKIYSIGKLLHDALISIQKEHSIEDTAKTISKVHELSIEKETLETHINEFVTKISDSTKNQSTLYNYIYFKVKLFGSKSIDFVSSFMSILFHKYLLLILAPIAIYFTAGLFGLLYADGIINTQSSLKETFSGLFLMYGGIATLGLVHEFGHSSAASYYKQPSDIIGFGIYIVFPVFYSDVSKIWNLNKWKRIVVNLGGIYFQLLMNILFYFLYLYIESIDYKIILKFFIFANFILLVYALNPFLRNDGYWVYSDFFGIKNLTQRATLFPKEFFRTMKTEITFKEKLRFTYKNFPLLFYSFFFYIIMIVLILGLVYLTYLNVINIKDFILSWQEIDWNTALVYREIFGLIFGLFINLYFLSMILKRLVFKKLNSF